MTNQRLVELIKILAANRKRGVKLTGKSVLERELNDFINRPTIKLQLPPEPPALEPPVPYEVEMGI